MADNFAVNQYERLLPVKISYDGGEVDVSGALTTLSIKEDIFMSSMSCKMAVVDTSDSLGVVDFDGTETFKISFKSLVWKTLFLIPLSTKVGTYCRKHS